MRVSVYIVCYMIVFGFGMLPLLPPVAEFIVSFFHDNTFISTYYITVTFKASIMPGILSIAILLVGSLVTYCIYKGGTCYWRKEHVKDVHFVPGIYNDDDDSIL